VLRSFRLEDGAWKAVSQAHTGRQVIRRPQAPPIGDTRVVGRTGSDQAVDVGIAHPGDCEPGLGRAALKGG
jgi:hypothetical protein